MPTDFQTAETITIPKGTGRRNFPGSVTFGSKVNRATVALRGYKLDFAPNGVDHHINVVEVDTDLGVISENTVNFSVQCQYADKNFDDPYEGYVQVLVVADVA